MFQIVKEPGRVRTTWKSGARQRDAGIRWYVYKDGLQLRLPGPNTRDGGFTTRAAAEAWIDSRSGK
jgi:hypothetical protein